MKRAKMTPAEEASREEVVRYQRAFERLRAAALSPSRSAQLIRVLSRSYNG